ncbi:hypothetical protein Tco_0919286 [Tanacetum coccineum]
MSWNCYIVRCSVNYSMELLLLCQSLPLFILLIIPINVNNITQLTSTTTDVADPPPLNIHSTHQTPTQVPTVNAPENIIQAETNTENAKGETSSCYVDLSNMHTFYQHHPYAQHWTKDHPLEQVIVNPSQSVRTRRQLETDGEMCMFTLTVSRTEPKNINKAMADSAWIESIQEELHQFDRLDVWELVDRPDIC